jgi:hypothetical protein
VTSSSPGLASSVTVAPEQTSADAGALDGERKTVTALFADIKGSMDLIEDLDPEEARRLVDPALKLMMDAVHRYEGYVAQSTGDGNFALFGAPVAHEDHPQRALHAARRMQEDLKRYADKLRERGQPPRKASAALVKPRADLGVTFPNSNTIGDFDPEIAWRLKYAGARPVKFEAGRFIRKRVWQGPSREKVLRTHLTKVDPDVRRLMCGSKHFHQPVSREGPCKLVLIYQPIALFASENPLISRVVRAFRGSPMNFPAHDLSVRIART